MTKWDLSQEGKGGFNYREISVIQHINRTKETNHIINSIDAKKHVTKKKKSFHDKNTTRGFSGGPVVKNPPCNAGDTGSTPGPRRSHTAEQLSLCTTTRRLQSPRLQLLSPCAQSPRSTSPHSPQLQKAHAKQRRPSAAKKAKTRGLPQESSSWAQV